MNLITPRVLVSFRSIFIKSNWPNTSFGHLLNLMNDHSEVQFHLRSLKIIQSFSNNYNFIFIRHYSRFVIQHFSKDKYELRKCRNSIDIMKRTDIGQRTQDPKLKEAKKNINENYEQIKQLLNETDSDKYYDVRDIREKDESERKAKSTEPKSKETKEEKIKRLNDEITALKKTKVDLEYVKKMLHLFNQMYQEDLLNHKEHEDFIK